MAASILDLGLSRLAVGTVQFGMSYGIANRTGQPSYREVCDILACAVEHGVTTLDTAAAYGDSESVLGRALRDIGATNRVTIVSKVLPVQRMEQAHTPENAARWIRNSVISSLERLGTDSLPVCLLHRTEDIPHMAAMLELKKEGLVQHIGVSAGPPEEMATILSAPGVEAVQVPLNLLDQRVPRSGDLSGAAESGIAVFVRSIYLQGLLLMPEDEIAPQLQDVVPYRRALQRIAGDAGLNMSELALRYGLSLPGVTSVLTGVETVEQMQANIDIVAQGPLPPEIMTEIDKAVPDLSETIILSPWLWPSST
jgi:aryl-alcohol dehydrogenase-like predicted oxidoreductase